MRNQGSGCEVLGFTMHKLGFRFQGLGFRVYGSGFRISDWVLNLGFKV
jgi:hypothetical protein